MRLALTCGYRVFVCSNMAFSGDFAPGTMFPKLPDRRQYTQRATLLAIYGRPESGKT